MSHACEICSWIETIYSLLYGKNDRDKKDILEKSILEQEFKLFGDLNKWKENKNYYYSWKSFIDVIGNSYIGVTILLNRLPNTDTFHVERLMHLIVNVYYSKTDYKEIFYKVMKIDSEVSNLSDNDNIHLLYKFLINRMSEENKNTISVRSILCIVNKLSTFKFLLEQLNLEFKVVSTLTDKYSLTFRDIVFFNIFLEKLDIIEYIIEKNKENYPTKLEQVLNGHINDITHFSKIINFSKLKGWSLLITKKDLDKANWWVRHNVNLESSNKVYDHMYDLYKEQNIQKILLIKYILSKFPEDIEKYIGKFISYLMYYYLK